ncbi:MAG: hypothetical protein IKV39_01370 [Clostridia bacterium]|nr:hypothetical protein [Clostridia bacterium]
MYIMILILGFIGVVLLRNSIKSGRTSLVITSAVVIVWDLAMLLFLILKNGPALIQTLLLGFGVLLTFLGAFMLSITIKCKERIVGTYISYDGGGKHGVPVFEYEYNGETFTEKCSSAYSRHHMENYFNLGEEYHIYINPQKPKDFKLYPGPSAVAFIELLIGLALLGLVIASFVIPETISINIEI